MRTRTGVGIVGGGPAGLMLGHLLRQANIDVVVLESQPRAYAERRVRASVLEPGSVEFLIASGVGERLRVEGTVHESIELRFDGQAHLIPLNGTITVYEQQDIVRDLIRSGGQVEFEANVTEVTGANSDQPVIHYRQAGEVLELQCDIVAGCDGRWGISRSAIPANVCKTFRRDYPFAWLGALAAMPSTHSGPVYASHPRGFALWGLGTAELTRLYLQSRPGETVDDWPDERIWQEVTARLATDDHSDIGTGEIVEKGVMTLHSVIVEPMQYGRLFLVGDAAHVMPPTGAKGLNLAIAEVQILAPAIIAFYQHGYTDLLEAYSSECSRRVWWAERVSSWMTWLLHSTDDEYEQRLQLAQLRQLVTSRTAAAAFAEDYLGLASI